MTTFFFDRHVPPRLARAVTALAQPRHAAVASVDAFEDDPGDVGWILACRDRGWVAVTADRHILTRNAERRALVESRVRTYILGSRVAQPADWPSYLKFLKLWKQILDHAEAGPPACVYEVGDWSGRFRRQL